MRALQPEAFPVVCLLAVGAALATTAVAFAHPTPATVLVFSTPVVDVLVAAYDTPEDCDEVRWTLQRYTTAPATYTCQPEEAQ